MRDRNTEGKRAKDLIRCPAGSYLIDREICEARRAGGFSHCTRCPENTRQLEMFETPLQVAAKRRRRKKPRPAKRGGL